jgi:galactokinase
MYEYRHIDELTQGGLTPLDQLTRIDAVTGALESGGLNGEASALAAAHLTRCAAHFMASGQASVPAFAGFVPGRIEVLGKHTDYAGGGSLICALQRGISVVAIPREDNRATITDVATGESCEITIAPTEENRPGHWSDYAVVVCRRLSRDFPNVQTGVDIAFSSNLPRASGMSSSSALTVAIALSVIRANGLGNLERFSSLFDRTEDLAQYLGAVENGLPYLTLRGDTGVGTFGGSEDHTAILCSQPGLMKWYSYSPVRFHEAVAIPEHHVFALGFCGTHAVKTGAILDRYNYLSDSTAAVAAAWRLAMDRDEAHLGAISAIPGYSRTEVALAIRECPSDRYTVRQLTDRLDHFHHENNLILPAAVDALEENHMDRFTELVDRSQQLAETLLQNQTDETILLVRSARDLGAVAASAFGAGFGGSVWALIHEDRAGEFVNTWAASYRDAQPDAGARSVFFLDSPGPAALWLSL